MIFPHTNLNSRLWSCAAQLLFTLVVTYPHSAAQTPDYNLSLLSKTPMVNGVTQDVWGWVHPTDGREYALVCTGVSLDIFEVTVPTAPVLRVSVPNLGTDLKDVKTMGRYAYTASQEGPVQVIDLFNLPNSATTVGTFFFPQFGSHNIYIDSVRQLAYLGMNGAGNRDVHILDLSNPTQPTTAANFDQRSQICAGSVDDTHDAWADGNICYYASLTAGLLVLDVTNKNAPSLIGSHRYKGNAAHNVWGSPGGNYVYVTDEIQNGHLRVFDVSNLRRIHEVGFYQAKPGTIIHNVFLRDTLAFISYYTEGVKVINLVDPETPVEVGSFDTFPQSPTGNFDGCWGVYPYLPSGVILASDRTNGLFVLSFTEVNHGWLAGTVTDATGAPVPAARVSVLNTNLETFTDQNGAYRMPALNGSGLISIFRSGYVAYFQQVMMAQNTTTTFSPVLAPESGAQVSGQALTADGVVDTLRVSVRNHFFDPVRPDINMRYDVGNIRSGPQVIAAYAWGYKPAELLIEVAGAPVNHLLIAEIGYEDNFEWDQGWQVGDVTAQSGVWERTIPYGGPGFSNPMQPETDHGGGPDSKCWITNGAPRGVGVGDALTGGSATLFSPKLDLSGYSDPHVSYWRWYSDNDDNFPIPEGFRSAVSNNGGASWVTLESTSQRVNAWLQRDYRLTDFVTLTNNMMFSFTAGTQCKPASVEVALDDFSVYDADPARCCAL
ncbi:MAG: choice-of-anchor B family protein, partial [candidate division Zixibacteria bacterium]|nr:choice-of-anchor B family protein [candidate division Zixibacteria bacterium]